MNRHQKVSHVIESMHIDYWQLKRIRKLLIFLNKPILAGEQSRYSGLHCNINRYEHSTESLFVRVSKPKVARMLWLL